MASHGTIIASAAETGVETEEVASPAKIICILDCELANHCNKQRRMLNETEGEHKLAQRRCESKHTCSKTSLRQMATQ